MNRMPIFSLMMYLYVNTKKDGTPEDFMMPTAEELLGRAGLLLATRDILGEDYAAAVREHGMPDFSGLGRSGLN